MTKLIVNTGKLDLIEFSHINMKKDYKFCQAQFSKEDDYKEALKLKFFDYREAHTRIVKYLEKSQLELYQTPLRTFIIRNIPKTWNHLFFNQFLEKFTDITPKILSSKVSFNYLWRGDMDFEGDVKGYEESVIRQFTSSEY